MTYICFIFFSLVLLHLPQFDLFRVNRFSTDRNNVKIDRDSDVVDPPMTSLNFKQRFKAQRQATPYFTTSITYA